MIGDLISTADPLEIHSKFKENRLSGQKFLRLRRAKKGCALRAQPESATLAVTIIPVSPQWESPPRESTQLLSRSASPTG